MSDPASYAELIEEAKADARELVRLERRGAVARVTLNDPAKFNVLSAPLTLQLQTILRDLAADLQVRAVILTGADPAFSAGGDVRLMTKAQNIIGRSEDGAIGLWRWIRLQFGGIARQLALTDKVFIA